MGDIPTFNGWGPSVQYDNGFNPSVAIGYQTIPVPGGLGSNVPTIVEVHNGDGGQMWYHVGQVTGSPIPWGPSIIGLLPHTR